MPRLVSLNRINLRIINKGKKISFIFNSIAQVSQIIMQNLIQSNIKIQYKKDQCKKPFTFPSQIKN